MQTATSAPPIERELHIDATPETVYGFFTDRDKLLRWMGRKAEVDARPGGTLRIDYNGFDVMRGEFRELVPHSRIVYSWGWETLGDAAGPGQSTVEVTLTPEKGGTRLKLVHSGVSGESHAGISQGWADLLPRLAEQASGAEAPAPAPALLPAEELASRLNTALIHLRWVIEDCPTERWTATTEGGWTVAATADHAVFHTGVVGLARAVADGQHPPQADITLDQLSQRNDEQARERAAVSREVVLAALLLDGPKAVEAVKAFTDADLARSTTLAAAGGATVSAAEILAGPLVGNIEEHTASIANALNRSNA